MHSTQESREEPRGGHLITLRELREEVTGVRVARSWRENVLRITGQGVRDGESRRGRGRTGAGMK